MLKLRSDALHVTLALSLALSLLAGRAEANPEVWRRSYALEAQGDSRGALTVTTSCSSMGIVASPTVAVAWSCMWRCGVAERPELPQRPSTSPAATAR